jgi:hypothetical protein
MKEGDLVMVVGTLDDRVRNKDSDSPRIGTIVGFNRDEVIVLLNNGDLWKGPKREVIFHNEQ